MTNGRIGIIGGSGLYNIEGITDVENIKVETPFGDPSDLFITGKSGREKCCFPPTTRKDPQYITIRIKFSCKYLWHEETWSRENNCCQCRREYERRDQTSGYSDP